MFPFFMQNNCNFGNWYPSGMNYDMCSTNPWNSINLHMNQAWDDMLARQNLYNVQAYDFNNMFLYGNSIGGNSYLTDPRYTLAQMKFANGSMPIFGNVGNSNFDGMDFSNLWNNPFGGSGSSSSGSSKAQTPEERAYQRRYNKLLALCKQLSQSKKLSESKRNDLSDATHDTKGTYKERFEKLKKEYDKIDKSIVKATILELEKTMGAEKYEKAGYEDSFKGQLTNAGYEYSKTDVDKKIDNLRDAIKDLGQNPNIEADAIIGACGFAKSGGKATYKILDVLSSWNTQYADENDTRNIIRFIAAHYPKDDNDKKTATEKVLKPVVRALTGEAKNYLDELDDASKEKLDKAIKKVEKLLDKSETSVAAGLAEAFDELYVLTREAAIVTLQNDIIQNYGAIDPELFNDELFIQDTLDDLENEGLTRGEIEMKVSKTREEHAAENIAPIKEAAEDEDDEEKVKKTETEQIKDIEETVVTTITTDKYKDEAGKEHEIVVENNITGNRDAKRIFIKTDEGLKEVANAEINSEGKLVAKAGKKLTIKGVVKSATIKADLDAVEKAKADAKTAAKAEAEEATRVAKKKAEEYKAEDTEAQEIGKQLVDILSDFQSTTNLGKIVEELDKINAKNVMEVLRGHRKNCSVFKGDQFFRQLSFQQSFSKEQREAIAKKILGYIIENLEVRAKGTENEMLKNDIEKDIKELKERLNEDVFKPCNHIDGIRCSCIDYIVKKYII